MKKKIFLIISGEKLMKKIIIIIYILFIISNLYSYDILNELIERLNKNRYFEFFHGYNELVKENKLYLIPKIFPSIGVEIIIDDNIVYIRTGNNPAVFGLVDYKVSKNENKYIIIGKPILKGINDDKFKYEIIFDKNFLELIVNDDKVSSHLFYIDVNKNF